jgi:hypothetical protein
MEPRVRFWWVVAAIFLAVSIYFLVQGAYAWHRENFLLDNGMAIDATVDVVASGGINTGGIDGKIQPPDGRVSAHYIFNGSYYQMVGWLKGRTEWITIGKTVPLHIDPAHPEDWTGITSPIALIKEDDFIHGLGVLPIALLLFCVAIWCRNRMVRLWIDGSAVEATVIESRISAIAPGLRELRCAPILEGQQRVQRVFSPARSGPAAPGDRVWLLCDRDQKRAVAAAWFE